MTPDKKQAELREWVEWYGGSLAGKVYGHPSFKDGTYVRTSKVVALDKVKNLAETQNTVYRLVDPASPEATW